MTTLSHLQSTLPTTADQVLIEMPALQKTLRCWAAGQPLPSDLLDLKLLQDQKRNSTIDRGLRLIEIIHQEVTQAQHLWRQRLSQPEPLTCTNRLACIQAARQDFQASADGDKAHLMAWSALYYRYLSPVPLRTAELAPIIGISQRQFRRYLANGLHQLCIRVHQLENKAIKRVRHQALMQYLPVASTAHPVGLDHLLDQIVKQLDKQSGIVMLTGLPGSGKSLAARTLIQRLLNTNIQLDEVVWLPSYRDHTAIKLDCSGSEMVSTFIEELWSQCVDIKHSELSTRTQFRHLRSALRLKRYIIVLEDLDGYSDQEAILNVLSELSAYFIITSRSTLRGISPAQTYKLPPLTDLETRTLLQQHLMEFPHAPPLSDTDIKRFRAMMSGHPASLRWIAEQCGKFPLSEVIRCLQLECEGALPIFAALKQIWEALDSTSQRLLISLADERTQPVYGIQATDDQWRALSRLHRHHLIEISHSHTRNSYTVPPIINWYLRSQKLI